MNTYITRISILSTVFTVAILGVTAFFISQLFDSAPAAEAAFVCPADTECPYDSNGNFIGYKNAWPTGCQTILPGAKSNPALNMYNPLDLRSSTTAPQCYPTDVSAFGFTYYGRGHRMRNIGTYIDRNGCAQKFNADGTFLRTECGLATGQTTTTTQTGTVAGASTANSGGVVSTISPNTSFKYANSGTLYYVTLANCKEAYMSAATAAAWKVDMQTVPVVSDSVQYSDCYPNFVRLPENSIATADGIAMYLIRGNYKYVFTNYQGFISRGYSVGQAVRIPQAELDLYLNGNSIN